MADKRAPSPPRCALTARDRGDDLAGTASTFRRFLLVEDDGPWGRSILRPATGGPRRPGAFTVDDGRTLLRRAGAAQTRVLLIRRGERRAAGAPSRIFVAFTHPTAPVLETTRLDDVRGVLDLNLSELGPGTGLGLDPHPRPLYAVCTHGRHDACCALEGRPTFAELTLRASPVRERVWQVSHIGGDRFAGNMLVFGARPHSAGLYYGRLSPRNAPDVVAAHESGHLSLEPFRGRSHWPMPVQYAEIALRRRLNLTALDALALVAQHRENALTRVTFARNDTGSPENVTLTVRSHLDAQPARLTCHSTHAEPPLTHEIVGEVRGYPGTSFNSA